jgi:hypothetical protein
MHAKVPMRHPAYIAAIKAIQQSGHLGSNAIVMTVPMPVQAPGTTARRLLLRGTGQQRPSLAANELPAFSCSPVRSDNCVRQINML